MTYPFLINPSLDIESIIITTPRMKICPFYTDGINFEDLTYAFCEANEKLYISTHLPNVQEEREYIDRAILDRKAGKTIEFFIFNLENGELMGSCGISDLDTPEPNIGIWIRKKHHQKGYATEAYTALLQWISKEINLPFFKHAVNRENIASIKLAEKYNGILQEGNLTDRGHIKYFIYVDQIGK